MSSKILARGPLEHPDVGILQNGSALFLKRDYWVTVENHVFTLPSGYQFVASVPRLFWIFISPFELGIRAPLIHDYLYFLNEKGTCPFSRRSVDKFFYRLMLEEGLPQWRATCGYVAVRLGGWTKW